MRRHPTPGVAGYLVAVVVSIGVAVVLIVLTQVPLTSPAQLFAALFVAVVYVTVFAVPSAPLGVLVVHVCCRRVEAQWVHVLAAGLAGVLTAMTFGAIAAELSGVFTVLPLAACIGLATAAGRAAVIPLCAAAGPPVDNDFVPGRTAC